MNNLNVHISSVNCRGLNYHKNGERILCSSESGKIQNRPLARYSLFKRKTMNFPLEANKVLRYYLRVIIDSGGKLRFCFLIIFIIRFMIVSGVEKAIS